MKHVHTVVWISQTAPAIVGTSNFQSQYLTPSCLTCCTKLSSLSVLHVSAYIVWSISPQSFIFLEHRVDLFLMIIFVVTKLPGKQKAVEIKELEGLPGDVLRQIAVRNLATRPRAPCKLCGSGSWSIRHINKQQLVLHPISIAGGNRSKAKLKDEVEEDCSDLLGYTAEDRRIEQKSSSLFIDMCDGSEASKIEAAYAENLSIARSMLCEAMKSQQQSKEICFPPEMIRIMLRCLWAHDSDLLVLLFPMLQAARINHKYPTDVFFMDNVLLSPSLCRWPRHVGNLVYEHPETAVYVRIVKRAQCLHNIVEFIRQRNERSNSVDVGKLLETQTTTSDGDTIDDTQSEGALKLATVLLQAAVNGIYDMNMAITPLGLESRSGASSNAIRLPGIRQRLERKEGLFRMHMMGKRVNFACRSVISPDPNLSVTEVGVPLFFASRLTFPTPVTKFNLIHLRQLVMNGPNNYPGATSIQFSNGIITMLPPNNTPQAKKKREMLALRLKPLISGKDVIPIVVNRHLLEGDMLIMNRQPTLHRPSMQAHRVRIINCKDAKTLRLHYSNCKAYNADFDGDEMNGHFVQSYAAQAELETLASVPHQYLVPKDGTPLAGLIQDHVIAAVKLTMRDMFFERDDYMDLVYHGLRPLFSMNKQSSLGPPSIITVRPAICWPKHLWTGKQVVSTLLINLTPPCLLPLNATLRGRRTKAELWSGAAPGDPTPLSDVDLVICDGYLASGMLDKSHIGSSSTGLIHCVYEAYGPESASCLLNGISLLANRFLKFIAFTMGLKDILLSHRADQERQRRFSNLKDLGLCAFADAFNLKPDEITEFNVKRLYRQAHFPSPTDQSSQGRLAQLDMAIKDRLKRAQDAVCDSAIPGGLYVGFPENNLQLMVHVGAKGGMVNAQQMSVALGQIELEGRRVPMMLSGKTLPSFPPYDVRPRAGGMCTARFLTSLPAQELFFHSMAGRDGLVDTAVKTSRSGYLQRSAIKHLEDLSVRYDGTVRDSGSNIIQFRYGDDGVDVCQAAFLQPTGLHFFADNINLMKMRWHCDKINIDNPACAHLFEKNTLPKPIQIMADQVGVNRQCILHKTVSERKLSKILNTGKIARKMLKNMETELATKKYGLTNETFIEPPCSAAAELRDLCVAKIINAQAPPGDPVGLLAAQSVGEPSTQMTLNTFHFAGRGEMNVTLGIPRLREILMSGSSNISTPYMEVPIWPTKEAQQFSEQIAKKFYKLKLSEALRLPIDIIVNYASDSCTFQFNLQPLSSYSDHSFVTPVKVLRFLERVLFASLAHQLNEELKDQKKTSLIKSYALTALARQQQSSQNKGSEEPDEDIEIMNQRGAGRTRAQDEWNDDDGYEAIRRRRLEANAGEEDITGTPSIRRKDSNALDELVDLDLEEDDSEIAELHEIGRDREKYDDDDDNDEHQDNNGKWPWNELSPSSKLKMLFGNPLRSENKTSTSKDTDPNEFVQWTENPESSHSDAGEVELTQEDMEQNTVQDDVISQDEAHKRIMFVTSLHARFSSYDFDKRNTSPKWARLTICMFDPSEGRISIDLETLIMRLINRSVVSSVPGIEKTVIDRSKPNQWMFRVEGVNMIEMMRYPEVFDLNHLYTNNITVMNETYGIEAARAALQREVSGVFGHYGIHVDSRHLSLIGDYLTKLGVYNAFNRRSLSSHPSVLQQMTFETVTNVLRNSLQNDSVDNLVSPSASLVAGRIVHYAGTNCFELYQKLIC
ncbi:DNA-directed RNA polymerase I subunit RPA1 [Schistosoma japonicum]|uniref:DNA-directed RNA polymerase n=2 Tax=Schistosoma japonicum TaxID=6182 RepID=A0A4Z2DRZ9_SCHJA|nr:DNA-directed RNA polymerase I subunit RPA1 [Schistosoma japonicum]TNN19255.1 DNA-directed RNA polymerase I subunit RPA1 [Schistosoma japonicum]